MMSSHYIYIQCENCDKTESIYTGDVEAYDFDDADWEGEFIKVAECIACKEATDSPQSVKGNERTTDLPQASSEPEGKPNE
jgi:hypothetical protein